MRSPFEVFFGLNVVSSLRDKPQALLRIAKQAKPLLIGALRTGRYEDAGEGAAAEVSEAYENLLSMSRDEFDELAEVFLLSQRASEDGLKITVRELREANASLRQGSDGKNQQIANLTSALHAERAAHLSWVQAEFGLATRSWPQGAIARGVAHKYRVVVEYSPGKADNFFRGYEFDERGRVARAIKSNDLDMASGRVPLRRSSNSSLEVSTKDKSRSFLLGTTEGLTSGTNLESAIMDGEVQPFVAIDRKLVLAWVYLGRQKMSLDSASGRVAEIIPLG